MKETSKDQSRKKGLLIKYYNGQKFIIMDVTFASIFCFVRLIAYM